MEFDRLHITPLLKYKSLSNSIMKLGNSSSIHSIYHQIQCRVWHIIKEFSILKNSPCFYFRTNRTSKRSCGNQRTIFLILFFKMKFSVLFECGFDILYLTTILLIGFNMISKRPSNVQYTLFSFMCILLGLGDCFHLIPRIISKFIVDNPKVTAAVGYGNAITAIGMTAFYVIFMELIAIRYNQTLPIARPAVYFLFICRVILVLLPQNDWKNNSFDRNLSLVRNTPFVMIGIIVVVLLFIHSTKDPQDPFRWLPYLIIVSFGCYLPVALIHFSGPLNAILMIVKTLAYVSVVFIGYLNLSPVNPKYA